MNFSFAAHIGLSPVTTISGFAPYSALILSIVLVVLFLIRFYILQCFLLEKLHGSIYTQMDEITRRSFINHYIAAGTKLTIIIIAIYPFGSVNFGTAYFHTPYVHGSRVTMGDLLLIAAQLSTGMYIFELIYRVKISPVSVAHHIGSIMVIQVAIAISVGGAPESSIEFMLCTVWGAFDTIVDIIPHVALILYRVYPTSHLFLATVFKFTCITTFLGTISETILVMYMFGILWDRWPLSFKISTPVLHVALSVAQLHGSRIFYIICRKQKQQLNVERDCEK